MGIGSVNFCLPVHSEEAISTNVRFHYGGQMNTDAMNASACFTATFIKYRAPVKSTEYRTYPADLDSARSPVSCEINRQSRTMRHLDLQLIVGRRNEVGLTATAFKAGCGRHRLMQLLGTG